MKGLELTYLCFEFHNPVKMQIHLTSLGRIKVAAETVGKRLPFVGSGKTLGALGAFACFTTY